MVKKLPAMQETWVQSLGWEDSLGEGNGNPLQFSCLENSMDRGAWWATVNGVTQLDTTEVTKQQHERDYKSHKYLTKPTLSVSLT